MLSQVKSLRQFFVEEKINLSYLANMKYSNTEKGVFVSRPNRFIAEVMINGVIKICHVKNTGRCKELLIKGASVILEKSDNPLRKTQYDLIAVYKGDRLVNIDSQAPNRVFGEWAEKSGFFGRLTLIKPECRYKNSRFDFYLETDSRKIFAEVKGVTLENNHVAMFPDAPTERGVKHLKELSDAVRNGYEAYVFFVVQMKNCKYFTPNAATHPEFASALKTAAESGVKVCCVDCTVAENELHISGFVDVVL